MGASWVWQLCDAAGSTLAELTTASGRRISYKRNAPAEASFTISHDDDAASLLLDALSNTGVPILRCYRRAENDSAGVVRFRGSLVSVDEEAEEASTLTAAFRSPFATLLGNGNDTGRFLRETFDRWTTDAGVIALDLIEQANADSPTGLSTSQMREAIAYDAAHYTEPGFVRTFPLTRQRDRSCPVGTNVGQAITDLTALLDGFDFTETFVESGSTLAQFVVADSLGADNPGARFEYGDSTLANVRQVARQITTPANCVFVIGGNELTAYYEDAASVAKYGRFYAKAEFTDIVEQITLDDKARALVRREPVKTITFAPEASFAPSPFDDYDLGDTCRFFARSGALREDVPVRVNGFDVLLDDNGDEVAEVPDPTSPDENRILRAMLTTEVEG